MNEHLNPAPNIEGRLRHGILRVPEATYDARISFER